MKNWIFVAALGYFLTAFSVSIDKILLRKPIKHPVVFAFYGGSLSIFAMVFIPFGVSWPGIGQFLVSLISGIIFILAMISFYSALRENEVSKVAPVVGGLIPIFVLIGSNIFLNETFSVNQIIAFVFLVSGSVFISFENRGFQKENSILRALAKPALAAFLFSIFYVLLKYIYLNQEFLSGFVWSRLGSFLGAISLLVLSKPRKLIIENSKSLEVKMGGLFVVNKILGSAAFILVNYAIFLGSAAIVNAMEGIQYITIFILGNLLSITHPDIFKEEINKKALLQKITAIVLIGIGFVLLSSH